MPIPETLLTVEEAVFFQRLCLLGSPYFGTYRGICLFSLTQGTAVRADATPLTSEDCPDIRLSHAPVSGTLFLLTVQRSFPHAVAASQPLSAQLWLAHGMQSVARRRVASSKVLS